LEYISEQYRSIPRFQLLRVFSRAAFEYIAEVAFNVVRAVFFSLLKFLDFIRSTISRYEENYALKTVITY